ncbi:MAG TPA: flagellar biosynthetic protein FliQ [Polyangia bacterium]|jgi:flagellar biosynthesis protein FliQ|nr:flagellar biosynthetic protein FliQ [Polyangia bacterium]
MEVVPAALMREGFTLLASTAGPFIGGLLLVGLIVGILQAATQINDPAVGFLPRLAVALLGAWALGRWVLERYAHFLADAMQRMSAR